MTTLRKLPTAQPRTKRQAKNSASQRWMIISTWGRSLDLPQKMPNGCTSGALLLTAWRQRSLVEQRPFAADDGGIDDVLGLVLHVGQLVLDVQHHLLDDRAETAGSGVALLGPMGDLSQCALVELQLGVLHLKQLLILPDQSVLRLGEDSHERVL